MTKLTRDFIESQIQEESHTFRIGMYSSLISYLEVEHNVTSEEQLILKIQSGLKLIVADGWYSQVKDIKKD